MLADGRFFGARLHGSPVFRQSHNNANFQVLEVSAGAQISALERRGHAEVYTNPIRSNSIVTLQCTGARFSGLEAYLEYTQHVQPPTAGAPRN